jgi:hypothetical protein
MADRRTLKEALKAKPDAQRAEVEEFVYGATRQPSAPPPAPMAPSAQQAAPKISRVPFTTRLRADLAQALKRASLERQLQGIEPNQVQEILENALEPWLRANGYLA